MRDQGFEGVHVVGGGVFGGKESAGCIRQENCKSARICLLAAATIMFYNIP